MAASTVTSINRSSAEFEAKAAIFSHTADHAGIERRRRISPQAGRALEILGHAIEYLVDEYIHEGGKFNVTDPQVQAVLLLMERNREIYMACPEVPSLGERLRNWVRLRAA